MNQALGLIETVGLVAAIEAADTAVKAANVVLLGYEKTRGAGMITVKITGDVGAVKAAVTAAVMAANRVNEVYSYHVIPRPHAEIDPLIAWIDRGHGRDNGEAEGSKLPPPPPPAPVAPEPVAEEPVAEEPVAEEPVAEEPVAEEPVAEEPVAAEPVAEEPVAAEPVAEEPVAQAPELPASPPPLPAAEEEPAASRRCAAITRAGTRCRNRVVGGTPYCRQHQPRKTENAVEEEA